MPTVHPSSQPLSIQPTPKFQLFKMVSNTRDQANEGAGHQPTSEECRASTVPGISAGVFLPTRSPLRRLQDAIRAIIREGPRSTDARMEPVSPKATHACRRTGIDRQIGCPMCHKREEVWSDVLMMPCGHWCHVGCGSLWLNERGTCPVCHLKLR